MFSSPKKSNYLIQSVQPQSDVYAVLHIHENSVLFWSYLMISLRPAQILHPDLQPREFLSLEW